MNDKTPIVPTKNWKFDNNIPTHLVPICPQTCRPYYNVVDKYGFKTTWLDQAIEIYGHELFSTNNFFGNYVFERQKYPSKSEFLNYIFMYHYIRGKKTLPICVEQFVDEVFNDYENILESVTPKDFAERWNKSLYKDVRARMENRV